MACGMLQAYMPHAACRKPRSHALLSMAVRCSTQQQPIALALTSVAVSSYQHPVASSCWCCQIAGATGCAARKCGTVFLFLTCFSLVWQFIYYTIYVCMYVSMASYNRSPAWRVAHCKWQFQLFSLIAAGVFVIDYFLFLLFSIIFLLLLFRTRTITVA